MLLKLADRVEADAQEFASLESRNCGKPLAAVLNDEIPAIADVFRFFAGAARAQHGALAGEYLPGFTSMIRRDPARRRRVHRALELSADDGRLEALPGARRRQHRRHQAVGADAAHDAQARASSSPRSSRRAWST